jgi:pimeloyl-ACP methyl ester carboxylesterase
MNQEGPARLLGVTMPRCYVLPGILGSELSTTEGGLWLLWTNRDRLALGEFDRLELAANGIDPKPPRGKFCVAQRPLEEFYGEVIATLQDGLGSHGYIVKPWGYDWRKSIMGIGQALASEIQFAEPLDDPCTIVAHSQGGLVARAAWYTLKLAGEEGRIRRIVTLGTPHRGSYAPALVWCLQEELIGTLQLVLGAVQFVAGPFGISPIDHVPTLSEIAAITGTWPAMYDMLPLLDDLALVQDPQRAEAFDVDNWPAKLSLSSQHFSSSIAVWQPVLKDSRSTPPGEVLTTYAGTGFPTPYQLAAAGELGNPQAFRFSTAGDGRVMYSSAMVEGAKQLTAQTSHSGILFDSWVLSGLPEEVLEVRIPPVPPAPPIVSPIVSPSYGTGPPFRFTPDFGHDC